MKRLSFITQFKIEILLAFTSSRKVLGKMLACGGMQTLSVEMGYHMCKIVRSVINRIRKSNFRPDVCTI